jgi:glycosyltransferase involved in cell wall biosynthesis
LISFEHAATGAPQLVPAHSACEELWTTVDTVLPIRSKGEHVGLGMLRKFVEPDDIAATLENLYSNKQFRLEQAQKAYDNATQAAYKWDRIAAQWDDLLQRIRLDPVCSMTDQKGANYVYKQPDSDAYDPHQCR